MRAKIEGKACENSGESQVISVKVGIRNFFLTRAIEVRSDKLGANCRTQRSPLITQRLMSQFRRNATLPELGDGESSQFGCNWAECHIRNRQN